MTQRSLTSFFTKTDVQKTEDSEDNSSTSLKREKDLISKKDLTPKKNLNPEKENGKGKRKRLDSPSDKSSINKKSSKSTKKNEDSEETINTTPKSIQEKRKNKRSCTPKKAIKKFKRIQQPSDSSSESESTMIEETVTSSKENEKNRKQESKVSVDTSFELESTAIEESAKSVEKNEKNGKNGKNGKKESKVSTELQSNNSKSNEENHESLLDSSKETDNEEEKNISGQKSDTESNLEDEKEVNKFIITKKADKKTLESSSENEKEIVKKSKTSKKADNETHNFFAPKGNKSSKPDTEKSKKSAVDSYDPSATNYDPINDACWKKDEMVPYIALTRTLELIEETSARLKIIDILSNYFRSVIVLSPNDLLPSIYLCLNQLAPAYEGIILGVAETNLLKAIAQCTGRTLAQLKADVQFVGDIGIVAEGSRSNQRTIFQPAPLTVSHVYKSLKEIAQMIGHSSLSKKLNKIQSLFVACRLTEARFFIRSLAGKLRVGLAEQSLLQAIALATTKTPPEQDYPFEILDVSKSMSRDSFKQKYDEIALIIKTTYCECPNYDLIVPVLLKEGVQALPEKCKITPGIPIKPMLAHPTKGIQEVLTRFEGLEFTCEWKYDGERAQIHFKDNGEISIYSRNQENNTSKYPDIIARFKNTRKENVTNCILDCESVAWDNENKQILPFQVLSTRKRKNANEADIKVQVCVFMFDLLYLNDESLVQKPFQERRQLLKECFTEVEGEWTFATSLDTSKMEEVQEFLEESVKGNCEGLMIKTLEKEATYEIAKRSRNWLKLKKDYLDGMGDTLDLVVIGGYIGKGKRTGTYGGFLLACYDKENEEYQSLCKIGTGFSEEDLQKHTQFFKEHLITQSKSYYRFDSSHEPDHWFEPVQVWEIKCADLSLSPVHRAAIGIVDSEKGISVRFPRFIRVRDDKNTEDATTAQQVAEMYNSQEQIKNKSTDVNKMEEDFD
ncbi:DNA ligase 1 isoform X2 [Polistes fuscatus]|uniref:DNA ligase 1 isoform X2 n=1 Tax=Polistes fuscatus TaxID=30207 RepID=UPI001CA837C7|nr:DNA ligase 1 isoform X2 [Polistes fuscatus]